MRLLFCGLLMPQIEMFDCNVHYLSSRVEFLSPLSAKIRCFFSEFVLLLGFDGLAQRNLAIILSGLLLFIVRLCITILFISLALQH